jgi:hypothetical protein
VAVKLGPIRLCEVHTPPRYRESPIQVRKRRQLFLRVDPEPLSVATTRVNNLTIRGRGNPDRRRHQRIMRALRLTALCD